MPKFAIVATIKTVPGRRDEYLRFLDAHGKRCLATEPGTLQFDILLPQEEAEADTVMLYEVYASPEAFQTHWNGPSLQQMRQDVAELQVSIQGVRCNLVE
jgi:quinol monooxygenase YgiN